MLRVVLAYVFYFLGPEGERRIRKENEEQEKRKRRTKEKNKRTYHSLQRSLILLCPETSPDIFILYLNNTRHPAVSFADNLLTYRSPVKVIFASHHQIL